MKHYFERFLGLGRYFEGLIATAVAAEAEANAPGDEGMTDEEGAEVARLREEVDAFTSKYGDLQDSLRAGEVCPCVTPVIVVAVTIG